MLISKNMKKNKPKKNHFDYKNLLLIILVTILSLFIISIISKDNFNPY